MTLETLLFLSLGTLAMLQVKHLIIDWMWQPSFEYLNKGKLFHWGGIPFNAASASDVWHAGNFNPEGAASESEKGLGTGFGADKTYQTRKVTFNRANPSTPVYTRVITYDTLKGLRKRGVPVDPAPNGISNAFPASPELSRDGCRIPRNRG